MDYSEMSHTEIAKTINQLVAEFIAAPFDEARFEIDADQITNKTNSLLSELMKHARKRVVRLQPGPDNGYRGHHVTISGDLVNQLGIRIAECVRKVKVHVTEIITFKRKGDVETTDLEAIAGRIHRDINFIAGYCKR